MPAIGGYPDWPRRGAPWSVAEDERLFELARKYVFAGRGRHWERWCKVAAEMGRTTCGVMTRHGILKAVRAHQMAAEARRR